MKVALINQTVDLANLYVFRSLNEAAKIEKAKLKKQTGYLDSVLSFYSQQHEKLCEERYRLRLEIRLITKGTPVTEPMSESSASIEAFDLLSESQRNAMSELLKKAYKACAQLCHPDKGGSVEDFHELKDAYLNRDLVRINVLYISLVKGRNLYWQSSHEGIEWASTELDRSHVAQEKLKSTPLYDIVRAHAQQKIFKANTLMREYLCTEIQKLLAELNHLRNQNGQGNQESNFERENSVERQEERERTFSFGKGTVGEGVWKRKESE